MEIWLDNSCVDFDDELIVAYSIQYHDQALRGDK